MIGFVEKYSKKIEAAKVDIRAPIEEILVEATQAAMEHIKLRFVEVDKFLVNIHTRDYARTYVGFKDPVLVVEYEKEKKDIGVLRQNKINVTLAYAITKRELIRSLYAGCLDHPESEFLQDLNHKILNSHHHNLRGIAEMYELNTQQLRLILDKKEMEFKPKPKYKTRKLDEF